MSQASEALAGAPERLPVSTAQPDLAYRLATDLVAVHGSGGTAVRRLDAQPPTAGPERFGPVYRREPGGEAVVPTGLLLVRFDEDDSVEDHQEAVLSAGYRIDHVLPYARHAGYVRMASGSIADGLRQADRLEELDGIRLVEPQVLSERASRS